MKCDYDCFNCKYSDCISEGRLNPKPRTRKLDWNDPIARKEYMKQYRILNKKRKQKLSHEYYLQHREEIIERVKRNYYKKRDEM